MFKIVKVNQEGGLYIKIAQREEKIVDSIKETKIEFKCTECAFIAKSKAGLMAHSRNHKK